MCSAYMSSERARSAIVRATRAMRSRARAENCRFALALARRRRAASSSGQYVRIWFAGISAFAPSPCRQSVGGLSRAWRPRAREWRSSARRRRGAPYHRTGRVRFRSPICKSMRIDSGPESLPMYSADTLRRRSGIPRRANRDSRTGTDSSRRNQLKARAERKTYRRRAPSIVYRSLFERLAHDLDARTAPELRQLVQKEHAVMREADFPGLRQKTVPPPTSAVWLIVWCGKRKGRALTTPASSASNPATL